RVCRQAAGGGVLAFADQGRRCAVVSLAPPSAGELYEPLLERIGTSGLLAEGGVVVAEHFHKKVLPETIGGLVRTREVRVGDHRLSFYRRVAPGPAAPGRVE